MDYNKLLRKQPWRIGMRKPSSMFRWIDKHNKVHPAVEEVIEIDFNRDGRIIVAFAVVPPKTPMVKLVPYNERPFV